MAGRPPPNFKTDVHRNPTKKWAAAPSYSYAGDDWGGYDEFDEYGSYDERAPPPKPTGLRQRGQSNAASSAPPSQQLGRQGSFDYGDESRAFQAGSRPPQQYSPPKEASYMPPPVNDARQPPQQIRERLPANTYVQPQNSGTVPDYDRPYQQPSSGQPQPIVEGPFVPYPPSTSTQPPPSFDVSKPLPPAPAPAQESSVSSSSIDDTQTASFPPRKSSLTDQLGPARAPPAQQDNLSQPAAVAASAGDQIQAGSVADDAPRFVRPSDIYKRLENEKEKQRLSQDSGRPSMDSMNRAGAEVSAAPRTQARESLDVLPESLPPLNTAPERKSEYGLTGFSVTNPALAQAIGASLSPTSPSPVSETSFSASPVVETRPPLSLPQVHRVSGFGDDFWNSSMIGDNPVQRQGSSQQTGASMQPPLDQGPNDGFRSAVNRAFDADDGSSLRDGSQSSTLDPTLSRGSSTKDISPIMSKVPGAAKLSHQAADGEASQVQYPPPPAVPQSLESSKSRPTSSDTVRGQPSRTAGHTRDLSNESATSIPASYRRDLNPPGRDNSPARRLHIQTEQHIPEATAVEVDMASATSNYTSQTADSAPSGNPGSALDRTYTVDEPSYESPVEQQAARISSPPSASGRRTPTTTETLSRGADQHSRASSPGKTRVRSLANKYDEIHESRSQSPVSSVSSIPGRRMRQDTDGSSGSVGASSSEALHPPRPILPGAWVSYANSEVSATRDASYHDNDDYVTQSTPRANRNIGDQRASRPESEIPDFSPSTDKRTATGPSMAEDPLRALQAAGSAIGASLLSSVGMGTDTSESDETEDTESYARSEDDDEDEDEERTPEATPSRNFGYQHPRPLVPDANIYSPGSSTAPTPPMKDESSARGLSSGGAGYFPDAAPAPLKQRDTHSLASSQTGNESRWPSDRAASHMSVLPSPDDTESDKLRKDIVRSLNAPLQQEPESTIPASQAGETAPSAGSTLDSVGTDTSRGSTVLPREYDRYWASTSGQVGSGQESPDVSASPITTNVEAMSQAPMDATVSSQGQARPSLGRSRYSWEEEEDEAGDNGLQIAGAQRATADPSMATVNSPPAPAPSASPATITDAPQHSAESTVSRQPNIDDPTGREAIGYEVPTIDFGEEDALQSDTMHPAGMTRDLDEGSSAQPTLEQSGTQDPVDVTEASVGEKLLGPQIASHEEYSSLANVRTDRSVSGQQPKLVPFQEIMAIKTYGDRLDTYNQTRSEFAQLDTGLNSWLAQMVAAHPEHADAVEPNIKPMVESGFASSVRSKLAPGMSKMSRSHTSGGSSQPYYQQYLDSAGDLTSGNNNLPSSSTTQRESPAQSRSTSGQYKTKDSSHSVGGKASTVAKGLFAKGKSRFRSGNEKGQPLSEESSDSLHCTSRNSRSFDTDATTAPHAGPNSLKSTQPQTDTTATQPANTDSTLQANGTVEESSLRDQYPDRVPPYQFGGADARAYEPTARGPYRAPNEAAAMGNRNSAQTSNGAARGMTNGIGSLPDRNGVTTEDDPVPSTQPLVLRGPWQNGNTERGPPQMAQRHDNLPDKPPPRSPKRLSIDNGPNMTARQGNAQEYRPSPLHNAASQTSPMQTNMPGMPPYQFTENRMAPQEVRPAQRAVSAAPQGQRQLGPSKPALYRRSMEDRQRGENADARPLRVDTNFASQQPTSGARGHGSSDAITSPVSAPPPPENLDRLPPSVRNRYRQMGQSHPDLAGSNYSPNDSSYSMMSGALTSAGPTISDREATHDLANLQSPDTAPTHSDRTRRRSPWGRLRSRSRTHEDDDGVYEPASAVSQRSRRSSWGFRTRSKNSRKDLDDPHQQSSGEPPLPTPPSAYRADMMDRATPYRAGTNERDADFERTSRSRKRRSLSSMFFRTKSGRGSFEHGAMPAEQSGQYPTQGRPTYTNGAGLTAEPEEDSKRRTKHRSPSPWSRLTNRRSRARSLEPGVSSQDVGTASQPPMPNQSMDYDPQYPTTSGGYSTQQQTSANTYEQPPLSPSDEAAMVRAQYGSRRGSHATNDGRSASRVAGSGFASRHSMDNRVAGRDQPRPAMPYDGAGSQRRDASSTTLPAYGSARDNSGYGQSMRNASTPRPQTSGADGLAPSDEAELVRQREGRGKSMDVQRQAQSMDAQQRGPSYSDTGNNENRRVTPQYRGGTTGRSMATHQAVYGEPLTSSDEAAYVRQRESRGKSMDAQRQAQSMDVQRPAPTSFNMANFQNRREERDYRRGDNAAFMQGPPSSGVANYQSGRATPDSRGETSGRSMQGPQQSSGESLSPSDEAALVRERYGGRSTPRASTTPSRDDGPGMNRMHNSNRDRDQSMEAFPTSNNAMYSQAAQPRTSTSLVASHPGDSTTDDTITGRPRRTSTNRQMNPTAMAALQGDGTQTVPPVPHQSSMPSQRQPEARRASQPTSPTKRVSWFSNMFASNMGTTAEPMPKPETSSDSSAPSGIPTDEEKRHKRKSPGQINKLRRRSLQQKTPIQAGPAAGDWAAQVQQSLLGVEVSTPVDERRPNTWSSAPRQEESMPTASTSAQPTRSRGDHIAYLQENDIFPSRPPSRPQSTVYQSDTTPTQGVPLSRSYDTNNNSFGANRLAETPTSTYGSQSYDENIPPVPSLNGRNGNGIVNAAASYTPAPNVQEDRSARARKYQNQRRQQSPTFTRASPRQSQETNTRPPLPPSESDQQIPGLARSASYATPAPRRPPSSSSEAAFNTAGAAPMPTSTTQGQGYQQSPQAQGGAQQLSQAGPSYAQQPSQAQAYPHVEETVPTDPSDTDTDDIPPQPYVPWLKSTQTQGSGKSRRGSTPYVPPSITSPVLEGPYDPSRGGYGNGDGGYVAVPP